MRSFTADFGAAYSGLTTVGVTQLRPDGTAAVARTNAGVTDFGNGVYGAEIDVDATCAVLRWDSGTTPLRCAIEDVSILPTKSFGGSKILDVPNSPLVTNSLIRVLNDTLPGGAMGKNGVVDFQIELINYSAAAATIYIYLSGSPIYAAMFVGTTTMTFSIANRNSTQAQMSTGYLEGNVLRSVCNTDVELPLEVYFLKANAADDVSLRRFTYQIYRNDETRVEASYLSAGGVKQVFESDLLLPALPPRVTGDPQKTIRSLAASDYHFPEGFFCAVSQAWPFFADSLPVPTSLGRTAEWYGLGWAQMQTTQATAAYSPVTGAAPAGISATGLAIFDTLFATADSKGMSMIVNLTFDYTPGTPAWIAALGGGCWPLFIPAADPNRAALLASIGYYTRYIVQRYTTLYPAMNWSIEPIDEPIGSWSGGVADMVAVIGAVKAEVTNFGGGKVAVLSPSYGGDITYLNWEPPVHGTLKPTMQEYFENGGWDQVDVLSLHPYYGGPGIIDITPYKPYSVQGLFYHYLKLFDPEMNMLGNGKYIYLPAMLARLYPSLPGIVPGVGVAGKPVWVTECGESYTRTRDRNFFVRLALIASALGVSKYFFYYYSGTPYGALPSMDIANCRQAYTDAHNFLSGKTINFVNVNDDFSKVGAGIDGQVYLF